jgi:hypothetical protein
LIGYLDASAFVPLLVGESSSASCRPFWDNADAVISSRLLYVETAAALAQACLMNRLTPQAHHRCLALLDQLWAELDVIEVDETLVTRAATLAYQFELRGYDAMHCAAIEQVGDEDVVGAAGDRQLLDAWRGLAIATFDTNVA